MFDREVRGQLAMLMGGRAAEELSCEAVSTGAVDDIRRATELAQRAVSEFGLSAAVGPLSVGALLAGGDEFALRDSGSPVARCGVGGWWLVAGCWVWVWVWVQGVVQVGVRVRVWCGSGWAGAVD